MIAGGVDHGADIVEVQGELLDALPDVGIVVVEGRVAEDIGGDERSHRPQLATRLGEEARDGRQPRLGVVGLGVPGRRELAVSREADVVELDLVEALRDGLLGDGDGVVPNLLAERIHPGELLIVDPGLAGARVKDGPVGTVLGEHVVLEGDDARDGVDVARLEGGQEPLEVLDDDRPLRARLEGQWHRSAVRDEPAVALDVDDDCVELRARHELEHPFTDGLVGHAVVGQVGGAHHLGLERDGHVLGVCRQAAKLIARDLDEEGGTGFDGLRHEAAFLVRPELGRADPHRGAGQRRTTLGVQHPPAHRTVLLRWRGRRHVLLRGGRGDLALEEQGGGEQQPARDDDRGERARHERSVKDGALCAAGWYEKRIHPYS